MNDDITELKEAVRKIVTYEEYQNRLSKWTFVSFILILLVGCGISIYWDNRFKETGGTKNQAKDWYEVSSATSKGDLTEALNMADELLLRNPLNFEGYYKRGEIHLMMGSNEKAKDDFQTAFKIFPISKYKSAADAVASRLNQPDGEGVSK